MKKLICLPLLLLILVSCKEEAVNYATLSGKITNKNSDSIVISNPRSGYTKTLKVDENGAFKDTMNLKKDFYQFFDGKEYTMLFLGNGNNLSITTDAKDFDNTLTITGKGADEINFIQTSRTLEDALFKNEDALFNVSKEEFDNKVKSYTTDFNTKLNNKAYDSTFVSYQKENIKGLVSYLQRSFKQKRYIEDKLAKGMASPKFTNYENYKGGETSLDDLKGKYVYIDLWATWCGPCKAEIPFLQKVEKQYHDKNIEFVSISVDSEKDHPLWKDMVKEKNLSGTQLYAKGDKQFSKDYMVVGIPRFILLDPKGNIVDAQAPRPSDPKLVELFKSLNI